jgi:hypothetical protein
VIPALTATEEAAMQNRTDQVVAKLEADWPNWQIWVIHKAVGGITWCARRWDDEKQVLNADSPEHLAERLEDETVR